MLRISDGSVEITGATLTVSGDVIGGGKSLDNHTHMGVHGETTPPL
jgi:phage baseplate assembly protein gpV